MLAIGVYGFIAFDPVKAAVVVPFALVAAITILQPDPVKIPFLDLSIGPLILDYAVLTIGAAYAHGIITASEIRDGKEYLQARFPNQPKDSLRYLARAGDQVLFYDPTSNATVLYELKNVEPLSLIHVDNSKSSPKQTAAPTQSTTSTKPAAPPQAAPPTQPAAPK